MKQQSQRQIARQATRSYLRKMGFSAKEMTVSVALKAIDDISWADPTLIASRWWMRASVHQIKLFNKEWNKWYRQQ